MGKKKDDLELAEEQREVGIRIGPFHVARKRILRKSEKNVTIQESLEAKSTDVQTEERTPTSNHPLLERTILLRPDEYEEVPLGTLTRGTILALEAKELLSSNFSMFLMDTENLKAYRKSNSTSGALFLSRDYPKVAEIVTVDRTATYFIVITSRAVSSTREIWLRVEFAEEKSE
ncbi:MAG: hypothetical protein ABR879_05310 [Methanomassiliicoccales archaeon]